MYPFEEGERERGTQSEREKELRERHVRTAEPGTLPNNYLSLNLECGPRIQCQARGAGD